MTILTEADKTLQEYHKKFSVETKISTENFQSIKDTNYRIFFLKASSPLSRYFLKDFGS